ncbi:MAG: hypothetical protein ACI87E_001289 [Mariniblastus sp.]|jgi:hypothetical protein
MLKRSSRPFFAFVVLGLVAAGCQQSSDGTAREQAPEAGEEKPSEEKSAAATSFGSSRPEQLTGGHDNATSASIEVAAEAIQPHMAIGSDDRIHLAFIHRGNISVSTSQDRGKTFSDPIVAIDVQGRARGGAQRGPRIGVDKNGNITVTAPVTFDDAEYKKQYPTADLFLVRSIDGGKSWSKPRQVNEVTKQAPEALHWMTVSSDGKAHVAWLDRRDRDQQPGQDIYYATVVDGKVGANVKVATTVCECCAPGLAVDASGDPFVVFREGGSKPSREIFARWSTNGGRSFAEAIQINSQKTLEVG